jgi:hypothetical protein
MPELQARYCHFKSMGWGAFAGRFSVIVCLQWPIHVRIRGVNRFSEIVGQEMPTVRKKIAYASAAKKNGC